MGFVSRFPLAKLIHGNGHQPGLRITFDSILTKSCTGIAAQLASILAQRLERSIDSLNHSAGSKYLVSCPEPAESGYSARGGYPFPILMNGDSRIHFVITQERYRSSANQQLVLNAVTSIAIRTFPSYPGDF